MPPLTATTPQGTSPSTSNQWYMLPGYPVIIVSDWSRFYSLKTSVPQRPLRTRYGEHLEVEGVGILVLRLSPRYIVIVEAAYVPTAQRNIFPVFVLSRLGLGPQFDEDGMAFTSANGDFVLRAHRVGSSESISHMFMAGPVAPSNALTRSIAASVTALEEVFRETGELQGRAPASKTNEEVDELEAWMGRIRQQEAEGEDNFSPVISEFIASETRGSNAVALIMDEAFQVDIATGPAFF